MGDILKKTVPEMGQVFEQLKKIERLDEELNVHIDEMLNTEKASTSMRERFQQTKKERERAVAKLKSELELQHKVRRSTEEKLESFRGFLSKNVSGFQDANSEAREWGSLEVKVNKVILLTKKLIKKNRQQKRSLKSAADFKASHLRKVIPKQVYHKGGVNPKSGTVTTAAVNQIRSRLQYIELDPPAQPSIVTSFGNDTCVDSLLTKTTTPLLSTQSLSLLSKPQSGPIFSRNAPGREQQSMFRVKSPSCALDPNGSSLCSGNHLKSIKRPQPKIVNPSSFKKKREPDSKSKIDGDVSSNVLGNTSQVSGSASTTRAPPVESHLVQIQNAPLNPSQVEDVPHFEGTDYLEESCTRDNQGRFWEKAKTMKHKADDVRVKTIQALMYLKAGLYFILTGICLERDHEVDSSATFVMYRDALVFFRYISTRYRVRTDDVDPLEVKIAVLSLRCQSMLSCKLFNVRRPETRRTVQYLQEQIDRQRSSIAMPQVPISSSQGSTPPILNSPRSSRTSPEAYQSSQIITTVPSNLYSSMQNICSNTMYFINGQELWEEADMLVEKYRVQDLFVQLDRQLGPVSLHVPMIKLVQYVKHAIQILEEPVTTTRL